MSDVTVQRHFGFGSDEPVNFQTPSLSMVSGKWHYRGTSRGLRRVTHGGQMQKSERTARIFGENHTNFCHFKVDCAVNKKFLLVSVLALTR